MPNPKSNPYDRSTLEKATIASILLRGLPGKDGTRNMVYVGAWYLNEDFNSKEEDSKKESGFKFNQNFNYEILSQLVENNHAFLHVFQKPDGKLLAYLPAIKDEDEHKDLMATPFMETVWYLLSRHIEVFEFIPLNPGAVAAASLSSAASSSLSDGSSSSASASSSSGANSPSAGSGSGSGSRSSSVQRRPYDLNKCDEVIMHLYQMNQAARNAAALFRQSPTAHIVTVHLVIASGKAVYIEPRGSWKGRVSNLDRLEEYLQRVMGEHPKFNAMLSTFTKKYLGLQNIFNDTECGPIGAVVAWLLALYPDEELKELGKLLSNDTTERRNTLNDLVRQLSEHEQFGAIFNTAAADDQYERGDEDGVLLGFDVDSSARPVYDDKDRILAASDEEPDFRVDGEDEVVFESDGNEDNSSDDDRRQYKTAAASDEERDGFALVDSNDDEAETGVHDNAGLASKARPTASEAESSETNMSPAFRALRTGRRW